MEANGQLHAPFDLPTVERALLYNIGREKKLLPLPGIELRQKV
jgi:hypothetical protein